MVCRESRYELAQSIRDAGTPVVEIGRSSRHVVDLFALRAVVREANAFRPDIIHGAVYEGVTLAALAGRIARVPKIVLEETGDPSIRSWRGDVLLAALARLGDVTIGVSPPITEYLRERLRLDPQRVVLINNGVAPPCLPDERERTAIARALSISSEHFVVGSIGRVDDNHKRFSNLIDAVAILRDRIPELRLLIVGTGRDLDFLDRHARKNNVRDRVVFAGRRADVGSMYALMDVFALASEQESFGLVIVEAMFCGLPVVATRVGGIPHIVVEGETGYMVPRYSPPALATAIERLHADPQLSARLGAAGRRRAEAEFSAERYVRDVGALYERLVPRGAESFTSQA